MASYQPVSLAHPEVELRLAILLPASHYCSVHCELITVTPCLLEAYEVEFEALSYCWGKEIATNTIFINGKSHQVTPNLEHALRCLRYRFHRRLLWIDAICIDQSNLQERGKQVKRMDQIYRFAKQVNVWLGPESRESSSRRAMELLNYIGAQVE